MKVQSELVYAIIEGGQTESSSTFTFVDDLYINIRFGNLPTLQNYCVFYWLGSRRNLEINTLITFTDEHFICIYIELCNYLIMLENICHLYRDIK